MLRRLLCAVCALTLALLMALCACHKTQPPPGTPDGGVLRADEMYDYVLYSDPGYIRLTKYKGAGGAVILPAELEGVPVTAVGDRVFYWAKEVTEVVVPEGVRELGAAVFEDCTALTAVTLPATLEKLGDGVFVGCPALADIRLSPDNAAYQTRDGVLYTDSGRTLLLYPGGLTAETFVPSGEVTRIARRAFEGHQYLKHAVLPEGLTHIEEAAFSGCAALTDIALPATLVSLGVGAFSYSGLVALDLPANLTALPDQLCWGCDSLLSVTFPPALQTVGELAFSECLCLLELALPDTVTQIGPAAFYACELLKEVAVPPLVTELPRQAFAMCTWLERIDIPAGVTVIHEGALDGCTQELLTVYGAPDSAAQAFAQEQELAFAPLP